MPDDNLSQMFDTDTAPKAPPEPKKAPARKAPARRSTAKRGKSTMTDAELTKGLKELFAFIAAGVGAFDPIDGAILAANAEEQAKALVAVSKKNPQVRAALETVFVASTWGPVVTVAAATVVPIAARHGLAPLPIGQMLSPAAEDGSPLLRSTRAQDLAAMRDFAAGEETADVPFSPPVPGSADFGSPEQRGAGASSDGASSAH